MKIIIFDYYEPFAGLCNQLYLITNTINLANIQGEDIYINKMNIDIFNKTRVPFNEIIDIPKTNKNLKSNNINTQILQTVPDDCELYIPEMQIYPVSNIAILSSLEFNKTFVKKYNNVNGIHFRLDIDCIIHNLLGEDYYNKFMSGTIDIDCTNPEIINYSSYLLEQYIKYVEIVGFDKPYYICTSLGKSKIHEPLMWALEKLCNFIKNHGGEYITSCNDYQERELNAIVDLLTLRDSDNIIGFYGSSFSEGYCFKVNNFKEKKHNYYFVNGFVDNKIKIPFQKKENILFKTNESIIQNILFKTNVDNIIFFINHWGVPGSKILFIGDFLEFKNHFNYLDKLFIDKNPTKQIYLPDLEKVLPFINNTFDIVITQYRSSDISRILKPNGKIFFQK